jgi:AcrR family transcriptional regulator
LRARRCENIILEVKNAIPQVRAHHGPVAARSARRAIARREADHDDAVRRLVAASFALIRETGSLEPSVAAIVDRAGLSNQAFYRHFESKDELLLGVLDEGFHVLASYLAHRIAQAPGAEAKIRAWISGVLEQALQGDSAAATRPFAVSRARLAELFPDEVEASERALVEPLRGALAEAVASGALPHADPDRDAEAIYTLAIGWVQRVLTRREPGSRAEAEHLVEFALAALRRQAPRSGARSEPQASEDHKVDT